MQIIFTIEIALSTISLNDPYIKGENIPTYGFGDVDEYDYVIERFGDLLDLFD